MRRDWAIQSPTKNVLSGSLCCDRFLPIAKKPYRWSSVDTAALAGEVDQLGADETKQHATNRDTDR